MSVSPLVSTWYRCKVICSAGTAVYSTPIQVNIAAGLSGTYTVNSAVATGGTNFSSFTALANALNCGIVAPVTVNVVAGSGPYTESFKLNAIGGASATNKVRINGNGETIQLNPSTTTGGAQRIVVLDGTQYLTIDSLNIKSLSATYGWGIHVTGNAKYDSIINCTVDLSSVTGTSSTNANGIIVSGSSTSPTAAGTVSNLYILKNKVIAGSTGSGGGFYGIAYSGLSIAATNDSIFVNDNEVTNFYYYGIRYAFVKNGELSRNNIHRSTQTAISSSAYGIYAYFCQGIKVEGNKIHDFAVPAVNYAGTFYGLYNSHANNTAATPIVIANNIIYNLGSFTSSQFLAYTSGSYIGFYHNTIDASVVSTSGTGSMFGCYVVSNANSEFKNNIINITGGNLGPKYGMYYESNSTPANAQKNNINVNSSQTGLQNAYYYSSAFATLAAFQAAHPSEEIGSPSVDPLFTAASTGNFLPTASAVLGVGANVYASVPKDILGITRSFTPTIGAFESVPTALTDAKAISFVSPSGAFCANTSTPVKVVIGNGGANSITSLTVNWKLNGVTQTPLIYTNTLYSSVNTAGSNIDTVTLGTAVLLSGSNTIVVWVSNPNGTAGVNPGNDTISWTASSALPAGTYTINAGAATSTTNFQSFNAFSSALSYGICGPVVANVVLGSGPYSEQVQFTDVPGASSVNTIKLNGNGEVLQFDNTATNPYPIFNLYGAKYFTLNNLKIKTISATYGWGVLINGSAMRDSIVNCEIDMSTITGTTPVFANGIVISGSSTSPITPSLVSHVAIVNNTVNAGSPTAAGGAYYGIIFSGTSSVVPNDSIDIIGNTVTNFYYNGIGYYFVNGGSVSKNDVSRPAKTAIGNTCYAIYNYYGTGVKIEGNRVHDLAANGVSSTGTFYGIYNYNATNTTATPILIANNAVYSLGAFSGTQYGLYCYGPASNIYHNTVDMSVIQGTSASSMYGLYYSNNDGGNIKNNIINITGGNTGIKFGIYGDFASYTSNLQKNNVNVNSSQLGTQYTYSYGSAFANLAAFQIAYPTQELGSPSVDPLFASTATGNLTPTNAALLVAGENLLSSVPKDILGVSRTTTPTIGAFQTIPTQNNDAAITSLLNPSNLICAATIPFKVVFSNEGTNNINSLQVNWKLNGVLQTPYIYSGTLTPPTVSTGIHSDSAVIGNGTLISGANAIQVWTSLPNGVADFFNMNDTLTTTFTTTTFTALAISDSICFNGSTTINLTPSTGFGAEVIQWQNSFNGATWSNVTLGNTPSYFVIGAMGLGLYRAKITTNGIFCYSNADTINIVTPTITATTPASRCGTGTVNLSATANNETSVKWYANATGGTALATGGSYATPVISSTQTYYAAASFSGCESARSAVVATVTPLPVVNLGSDIVVCAGSSLTLNTGAANSTFTKLWNNAATTQTISVTTAGTYSVVVSNGTCSKSDTIVVSVNALPVVNLGDDTAICAGSTLTLNAGTANATYTKLWSNAATTQTIAVSTAGTYSVNVSNGACSKSDTIVLSVNALPVVNLGNDTAICAGSTLTLSAGTENATYAKLWSNAATTQTIAVSTAGTYSVNVSNGACSASDTIVVTQTPAATSGGITVTGTTPTFGFSATNHQNVTTYSWNFGNGATSTLTTPSNTYSITASAQTFTVTLIVYNDCGSDTVTKVVTVDGETGIKGLTLDANSLKLYPNPSQNQVVLENNSEYKMKNVIVHNILGQQVLKIAVDNNSKQTISVSGLAAGFYNMTVEFKQGKVVRKLEIVK